MKENEEMKKTQNNLKLQIHNTTVICKKNEELLNHIKSYCVLDDVIINLNQLQITFF